MRQEDRFGTLEPGKLADVIAVRGDPLDEPELFDDPDRIVLVMKDGAIVKNLIDARDGDGRAQPLKASESRA